MQRGHRDCEERYLQFVPQPPGDLIFILHLIPLRRFDFGHRFTNDFIQMGRRYYCKSTEYNSNFG